MKYASSILVLGLLVSTSIDAAELNLEIEAREIYNSNFFGQPTNEDPANSAEFGARLRLTEKQGRFRYDALYDGVYQHFWDQDDADALENRLRLRGEYAIDRRTKFQVTNRFRDVSNLQFSRDDIDLGDSGLDTRQARYLRNNMEALWSRELTRVSRLWFAGRHRWIDFEDNEFRSDSKSWEAAAGMSFQVAPGHRLGGGVSYTREDFDQVGARFASTGEYTTSDVSWEFQFSKNGQLTMRAGPAWIRSEEAPLSRAVAATFVGGENGGELFRANIESCGIDSSLGARLASRCDLGSADAPPLAAADLGPDIIFPFEPPATGLSEKDVVFFGGVSLQYVNADWSVDADLTRRQNTTYGDSAAAILNRLAWQIEYGEETRRWNAYFAGSLERREIPVLASEVDFTVIPGLGNAAERSDVIIRIRDSDDRRDTLTLVLGSRIDINAKTSASLEVRYRSLEQNRNDLPQVTDRFFVVLKLSYRFTPIRF